MYVLYFVHTCNKKDSFSRVIYYSVSFVLLLQLVQQFLEETLGPSPQTFRMDSLLQEMREIESAVTLHAPIPAPGVAALARDGLAPEDSIWAEQYLESGKHFDVRAWKILITIKICFS